MKGLKQELYKIVNQKQKNEYEDTSSIIAKVLLVLGFATAIVTTALCIYSYIDNRAYRKKWEEYDDCGI